MIDFTNEMNAPTGNADSNSAFMHDNVVRKTVSSFAYDAEENEAPIVIKVLGIGGGGCNSIQRMIQSGLKDVTFVAINTDKQVLDRSNADIKIQLGKELTGGNGAGSNPQIGQEAAKESEKEIRALLQGTDMVFLTAGMGGGTGTGATPVIAQIAVNMGILTVAVVTKPFSFEGPKKMKRAETGIEYLRECVDVLLLIPNEKVLPMCDHDTTMEQAFFLIDDILKDGVTAIVRVIADCAAMNIDFADIRTVMYNKGLAHMGTGVASGEKRGEKAVSLAINSPLLETSISGAKCALVYISGATGVGMLEMNEIGGLIREQIDENAEIKYGSNIDPDMGDDISITIIATDLSGDTYNEVKLNKAEEEQDSKVTYGLDANSGTDSSDREREVSLADLLDKIDSGTPKSEPKTSDDTSSFRIPNFDN